MTRDGRRFDSLEISEWPHAFPSLARASGVAVDEPWQVHHILGARFFEWVASEKRHWSYARIRAEFSKRCVALVDDLVAALAPRVGEMATIFIGGGSSEYVSLASLRERTGSEVKSIGTRTLHIDPDLVPLVGLHEIVFDRDVEVER